MKPPGASNDSLVSGHARRNAIALVGPGPPGTDAPPSSARPESAWAIVSSPGFYLIALALAALAAMARLTHRYRPSAATAPQARDQA